MKRLILEHPLITEKATQGAAFGVYVFRVQGSATKPEIRKALQEAYGVHAVDVRIIRTKAKQRRLGRTMGIKPGFKKAMVKLKSGQKLDVLPQ
jgi:large subunit ribosomal protein L23